MNKAEIVDALDKISLYFYGCYRNAGGGTRACEKFHDWMCAVDEAKDTLSLLKAQEVPDTNAGKWISVKERLPKRSGKYLIVAVEHGRIKHVTTSMFGTLFYMTGRMTHWKVTHWMPLPEPPKEEQDAKKET